MMKGKVVVTRRILDAGLRALREAGHTVEINPLDRDWTAEELRSAAHDAHGLLSMLTDRIDASLFDASPNLKVVANYAVGYNNVDLAVATQRGCFVTNTPGVLTNATADLAWALLMAAARRIAEGDQMVRRGEFRGWEPLLLIGAELSGRTLGIVGAGRIGQAVGRRAVGFEMAILYRSRSPKPDFETTTGARRCSLEELLRESDFVSLHCPLTPETRHLLDERRLALMKPSAILINTARGPVVDEKALVRALRGGKLAAAGLDVFEDEPQLAPGLTELSNVVLCPHLGSAATATRQRMGAMAAENIIAALDGRRPPNLVNTEVWKE
ncbi:MAG: D-glycerate dehydrogenase [bacterium]